MVKALCSGYFDDGIADGNLSKCFVNIGCGFTNCLSKEDVMRRKLQDEEHNSECDCSKCLRIRGNQFTQPFNRILEILGPYTSTQRASILMAATMILDNATFQGMVNIMIKNTKYHIGPNCPSRLCLKIKGHEGDCTKR